MARLIRDPSTKQFLCRNGTWAKTVDEAERFLEIHDAIDAIHRLDIAQADLVYIADEKANDGFAGVPVEVLVSQS